MPELKGHGRPAGKAPWLWAFGPAGQMQVLGLGPLLWTDGLWWPRELVDVCGSELDAQVPASMSWAGGRYLLHVTGLPERYPPHPGISCSIMGF